jgi:hypothetical protein
MKTILDDLIANLRRIKPETVYARSVSTEALDEAANANRGQLEKGILSNDTTLPNYKKATEARNNERVTKVTTSDIIKFKDTGQFHKSIKAKINRNGDLKLTSSSRKAVLAQDYVSANSITSDGTVLGLTQDNLHRWYKFFVDAEFKKALFNRIRYGQ